MFKKKTEFLLLGGLILTTLLFTLNIGAAFAQSEGQIGGIVYVDKNGNGIREEGEEGLKDVEVTFDSGGWQTAVSTDDSGAFSIALNPATWVVTITVPSGYTAADTSTEVFLEKAGDAVTNLEFPLVPQAAEDEESGEVLPESGGIVSSTVIIGALVGVLILGVIMLAVGQRRSKTNPL